MRGVAAMKESEIDTPKLKRKVNSTELSEAYETVKRGEHYKIGAGARKREPKEMIFFLEVVVPLCQEDGDLKLEKLKTEVELLEKLNSSGYALRCEKDNSIICEKEVSESEVEKEYEALEELFQK